MSKYGEPIDISYDPNKNKIYPLFTQYFGDLSMTKIKDVKSGATNFSMYLAKIHCLLSTEHRYVIVFVEGDKLPIGNNELLSNLEWINLQTRSLPENHNLPPQHYRPRRMPELMKKIELSQEQKDSSRNESSRTNYIYKSSDYPLQITLIPRKNEMEYQNKGTIVSALETYSTIISFV